MSVADYKLLSLSKILKKNNTINTTTFNKTILSARRHWSRHALDFGASVFARLAWTVAGLYNQYYYIQQNDIIGSTPLI